MSPYPSAFGLDMYDTITADKSGHPPPTSRHPLTLTAMSLYKIGTPLLPLLCAFTCHEKLMAPYPSAFQLDMHDTITADKSGHPPPTIPSVLVDLGNYRSSPSKMRLRLVLFGDSITEQSFTDGGWGAALTDRFAHQVRTPSPPSSPAMHLVIRLVRSS
jgi:hypothetical protein